MKKTLAIYLLLLLSFSLSAQTDTLLRYLDGELKVATKRENVAYEVVTLINRTPEGHFMVQDYFSETGKKLQQAYFDGKDSVTPIGPYLSFHKNGSVRCRGNFIAGKKVGTWRYWHDNNMLADSCLYNEKGNITGLARSWWDTGALRDSAFYHPDSNGHSYRWSYFPDLKLSGEGPVLNGSENGRWTHYYPSGKVSAMEDYSNGKLLDMQCFNEDGSRYAGKCQPEVDAEFPGGNEAWQKYIVNSISRRFDEMTKERASGKAVILFIIGTNGKIMETRVQESAGTKLDDYAKQIIQQAPKWTPARYHNRLVKAYRRQPINFKIEEVQ